MDEIYNAMRPCRTSCFKNSRRRTISTRSLPPCWYHWRSQSSDITSSSAKPCKASSSISAGPVSTVCTTANACADLICGFVICFSSTCINSDFPQLFSRFFKEYCLVAGLYLNQFSIRTGYLWPCTLKNTVTFCLFQKSRPAPPHLPIYYKQSVSGNVSPGYRQNNGFTVNCFTAGRSCAVSASINSCQIYEPAVR